MLSHQLSQYSTHQAASDFSDMSAVLTASRSADDSAIQAAAFEAYQSSDRSTYLTADDTNADFAADFTSNCKAITPTV